MNVVTPVIPSEAMIPPVGMDILVEGELDRYAGYLKLAAVSGAVLFGSYLLLERNIARLRRILLYLSASSIFGLLAAAVNTSEYGPSRIVLMILLLTTGFYVLSRPVMAIPAMLKRPFSTQFTSVAKAVAWFINLYARVIIISSGLFLIITGMHMLIVTDNFLRPVGVAFAVLGSLFIMPYYLFARWLQVASVVTAAITTIVTMRLLHVQYQIDLPILSDVYFPELPAQVYQLAWTLAFKLSPLYVAITILILMDVLILRFRKLERAKSKERTGLMVVCAVLFLFMFPAAGFIQAYEHPYLPYNPPSPSVQEGVGSVTAQPLPDPEIITNIEPNNAPSDVPDAGTTKSVPDNVPTEGTVTNKPQGTPNSDSRVEVTSDPGEQRLQTISW